MKRLIYIALAFLALSCKPEAYLGPLDSPVGNWEGYKGEYFFDGTKVAELDSCEFKGISFYKQGYCCIEGVKGSFPFIYNESNGDLQIDSTLWSVPTLTGAEMVMTFVDRIYPPEPEPAPEPENPEDESPEEGDAVSPDETPAPGDGAKSSEDGSAGDGSEGGEDPGEGDESNAGDGSEDDGSGDGGSEDDDSGDGGSEGEGSDEPVVPAVKPDKNGVILPAEYKGFTIEANKNGYFYINASGKKVYCNFKGWKNEADSLIIDFWYDTHTNYLVPLVVKSTN